jgi:signal transduction histidine kinase/ActR/RegA family two-component response regulator
MRGPLQLSRAARLVLIGASAAGLLFASVLVALVSENRHNEQVAQAAAVQARILADTVTAALSFGDRKALQEYVGALKADADVEAVGVYDERGRLVASFFRGPGAQAPSPTLKPASASGGIVVLTPVAQDGVRLGTVYLRDRAEPVLQRESRYLGPALLVLMACMMFVVMSLDARALDRANRDLQLQMQEREKAEAALRQSQKMEAIGRLTGGIAHDFNNMLAIVLGNLELLLRRSEDADPRLSRLAKGALEGAERASALTQRLLAFSRLQPLKPAPVDVSRVVTEMTELLHRTLGETIAIEAVLAAGLWRAEIDRPQLEAAIVNLAINARDAMPEGGKLTIETSNTYLDREYAAAGEDILPGQYVMVAITDTGSGIPPDVLPQVFEPFFTTKAAGVGTGLGLSQVHGFIRQSGGHVRIYSEYGVGTTVKLYLPRALGEAPPDAAPPPRLAVADHRGSTVLVAEDEAGVREFVTSALRELGYDVLAADGPEQALELLEAHPEVDLLLTDVIMPGINGRRLAEQALARRPTLKVVFMTGYTQNAIVHNGVLDPGTRLVSKPFTIAQLGRELDSALAEAS